MFQKFITFRRYIQSSIKKEINLQVHVDLKKGFVKKSFLMLYDNFRREERPRSATF